MNKDDELKITPLGGLGEIGLNCQLWESRDKVVMIDCGLMFPQDNHLGIDVLIPHFGAVRDVRNRLAAIILTHGHEDHIGALPWILPELEKTKIYSSRFTLELVKHKLEEFNLLGKVELIPVTEDSQVEIDPFVFHFFPVCHSIPFGFALGVETPAGKIIHSGDFKIDPDPIEKCGTDLDMFRKFAGDDGVRLLLSDSTNVMRPGTSVTEREVRDSLDEIFSSARGRIVVTLFSSHIQRIQEVCELAEKYGKTVIISGKSLATNINIASSLGYMQLPRHFHNIFYGKPEDMEPEKTVLIVTGAQGEPFSALSRMVWGEHKHLAIEKGDTVIMSSRIIPGHTRAILRLINEMYRLGAQVYYESSHHVHASGHAHADELVEMIRAVKPQLFIPVHGEYQHLVTHGKLAEQNGVCKENVICLEDGQPITLTSGSFQLAEPIHAEYTLVDGKGVGDVGASVLHERRLLGDEGMVAIALVISGTGEIVGEPLIKSLGFIYEPQSGDILEQAKELVLAEVKIEKNPEKLRDNIRSVVRRFFRKLLERDPVVVPLISVLQAESNNISE